MTAVDLATCTSTIHWFDLDITVRCISDPNHQGLHRDGTRWWDDNGLQQPRDTGHTIGAPHNRRHLTRTEVTDIRARAADGQAVPHIARVLGLDYQTVWACARRDTYRSIP